VGNCECIDLQRERAVKTFLVAYVVDSSEYP